MFRLANVCKQTPALHSRREIPSLSNGCSIRNVSFKVRPAEDLEWRNYRSGVLKVVMECKKVNREKVNGTINPLVSHYHIYIYGFDGTFIIGFV